MKKILAILLCGVMLLCAVSCKNSETDNQDKNGKTEDGKTQQPAFISQLEKNTWKDDLTEILSTVNEKPGNYAVGLMDINFDNLPEVLVAYPGGSLGNIFIEIYDLESGEKLVYYDAAQYSTGSDVYLCIFEHNEEYVILAEGTMRSFDFGWIQSTSLVSKNIDLEEHYLEAERLFAKSVYEEEGLFYDVNGKQVDKKQYDDYCQQFLEDYKEIGATRMQLIRWSSIETEDESELAENMADALINSSQEFVDNKK